MAKKGMEPAHDEHINVTPLIDIVMCLIIFFMICGRIAQTEVQGGIVVPHASEAQELAEQNGRIIINLMPHPDIPKENLLAAPILKVGAREVRMDELTKFLRAEKQSNKDLRLLVRADRELIYQHISPVLVSCAQADIRSVHFAAQPE